MNRMNQIIRKPLSDADLKTILGDCKIITYPELAKYNSLDELLPKAYDFVIVLLLETSQSGHWCALLRYSNTFVILELHFFIYFIINIISTLEKRC